MSVNVSKIKSYCLLFISAKFFFWQDSNLFVMILDMSLISRGCKNYHIIFNVGIPSLEVRNIRLVNIITSIVEESKLISENMSPNVIYFYILCQTPPVSCISYIFTLAKQGFITSDFHLVQEPRIFNCFHF